jgi:hypothetical protein
MDKKQRIIIQGAYIDHCFGIPIQIYNDKKLILVQEYWNIGKIVEKLSQEVKKKNIKPKEMLLILPMLIKP